MWEACPVIGGILRIWWHVFIRLDMTFDLSHVGNNGAEK